MLIQRFVIKDDMVGWYVDAHATAKNTLWCQNLIDAKIFFRLRHALRWQKRLDTGDEMITIRQVELNMRNSIRDIKTITEVGVVEKVSKPKTDVDKILAGEPIEDIPEPIQKISGLWDFIPRGTENKNENRRGYTRTRG